MSILLSFLQSVFTPISCFCFNLQNTSRKIELFAEYQYLFSNCCLQYCVMEQFSTVQRILIVKTFYLYEECVTQVQKLQTIFGRKEARCESTVCKLLLNK